MDTTKVCGACGEVKPPSDFYRHPETADGRAGVCKVCHKARMWKRRRENPAVQEYERRRAKTPERKAHAAAITARWRRENPDAYRAETAVGNALRDGRLTKGPCEVCGSADVHGHHDDYSKPLVVRWLCPLHHHRHHAAEKLEASA